MSAPAAPIVDPIARSIIALRSRLATRLQSPWALPILPMPASVTEFKRVASMTPFAAIGISEMDCSGGRVLGGPLSIHVVIGVRNPSNHDSRFFGDRAGPGLYPALVLAAALINGHTVEGLGSFSVTKIGTAYAEGFTDDAIATGMVSVSIALSFRDVIADPTAPPDFAGLSPDPDGSFISPR